MAMAHLKNESIIDSMCAIQACVVVQKSSLPLLYKHLVELRKRSIRRSGHRAFLVHQSQSNSSESLLSKCLCQVEWISFAEIQTNDLLSVFFPKSQREYATNVRVRTKPACVWSTKEDWYLPCTLNARYR